MATAMAEAIPITVGFHIGNVVMFLSHLYGNGFSFLRESTQNAIDEGANKIYVTINCKSCSILVFDNGRGASADEITRKFENIGLSLKQSRQDAIGSKGIGNLAGLAIAKQWQFISRKGGKQFMSYTFDRTELEKGNDVKVYAEPAQFALDSTAICTFRPNSLLKLSNVSEVTLRQLGDQEMIERTLREAFNTKLKTNNIELSVSYTDFKGKNAKFTVKPITYRGNKLDAVRQDTPLGYVDFVFYHSPNPVEKPTVLVLHQGVYSIPLMNFFMLKMLPERVKHLFFRGYFEGEIRLGFCTTNGSRSAFEPDDELKVFVEAVTAFADDVLAPYVDQVEQTDREERWRRIAEGVLKNLRDYFAKNPAMIPPTMKALVFKTVEGRNTANPGVTGAGVKTGQTARPKKPREPRPPLSTDALKKFKEESERRKRMQNLIGTPAKTRTIDFAEGLGIQFVYPDPEVDGFLWHSRTSGQGVVQINVANNTFLEAEKRGQAAVSRYLADLLHKELTCASIAPIDAVSYAKGFEFMMTNFWRSTL